MSVGASVLLFPLPGCSCSTFSHLLLGGTGCISGKRTVFGYMDIRQVLVSELTWVSHRVHTSDICALLWTVTFDCLGLQAAEKKIFLQESTNNHSIELLLYLHPRKDLSVLYRPSLSHSPHPEYHAGYTPTEEHVPEAECAAAYIWPGMGTYAITLHCAAASTSEQRRATRADPGAQPAVCESPHRGEPECSRWAARNLYGWLCWSEEDYSRVAGWHSDTTGQTGGENWVGGQYLLH